MRRGDLIDYPHRFRRAALVAVLTVLVLGLGLGAGFGTVLTRAFEAVHVDQFAQHFSSHSASHRTAR